MTNVQIIRSGAPALQIGSSAVPQHPFTSHLPRGELQISTRVPFQPVVMLAHWLICSVITGAAAAAVMSSSKGTTVLRPAACPSSAMGQPTVQHIIHQPIQVHTYINTCCQFYWTQIHPDAFHTCMFVLQSRPIDSTSTAVLPTVVASVTATRPQSPVITTVAAHSGDMVHG